MPKKSLKTVTKKPAAKKQKEAVVEKVVVEKTSPVRETKMSKLVELIKSAPEGISLKEISESLKWQAHTVRSAISRLNKNQNLGIVSDKSEGNSRLYKMAKKD